MNPSPLSRVALAAAATTILPLGVWLATAAAAGGLSVTPAVIEKTAAKGAGSPITLVNTTSGPLQITVTPRPWKQSRSGAVVPDRSRTLLASVSVSVRSFSLPAGARRTVVLALKGVPKSGSLYGSVETIGLPKPKSGKKNGITAAYRLVGSLRLNPASSRRKLKLAVATPRVSGRALALPVKNAGNTIGPITGTVRLRGSRGSRTVSISGRRILPGKTVDLALGTVKGLPAGAYSASVTLVQGGRSVLTTKRSFTVK